MKGQRIIEITEDGRFLGVDRGFLIVKSEGTEIGKIPLDDIASVICNANYALLSTSLISALAQNNIPLVICDRKTKKPSSFTLAVDCNYRQGDVMLAQSESSLPTKKSLWKEIVRLKLLQQAEVLKYFKKSDGAMMVGGLAGVVKSGDPENIEGRAAAVYWKALMGEYFKRDRDAGDENILLNYGYTVLRATITRAILAAGLHPSLGVHHKSSTNSARLADDLVEPFRAFIDLEVKSICNEGNGIDLNVENKRRLSGVIDRKIFTVANETTIQTAMHRFCKSLAQIFLGERSELDYDIVRGKYFYVETKNSNKSKRIQTNVDDGNV